MAPHAPPSDGGMENMWDFCTEAARAFSADPANAAAALPAVPPKGSQKEAWEGWLFAALHNHGFRAHVGAFLSVRSAQGSWLPTEVLERVLACLSPEKYMNKILIRGAAAGGVGGLQPVDIVGVVDQAATLWADYVGPGGAVLRGYTDLLCLTRGLLWPVQPVPAAALVHPLAPPLRGVPLERHLSAVHARAGTPVPDAEVWIPAILLAFVLLILGATPMALVFFKAGFRPAAGGPDFHIFYMSGAAIFGRFDGRVWPMVDLGRLGDVCLAIPLCIAFLAAGPNPLYLVASAHPYSDPPPYCKVHISLDGDRRFA